MSIQPASPFSAERLAFAKLLPKVELHAHLNGCCRPETIRRLIQDRNITLTADQQAALDCTGTRTLEACFVLFAIIHQITTTHEAIAGITQEVVSDFAADGCVYLELRTTPKSRPDCGMTKRSYVEAVLSGLGASTQAAADARQQPILVKLLLSIDRREGPEAAMETVELAAQYTSQGVVGVDLSGDPSIGAWAAWQPALLRARALGLKVTLHAAELYAPEEMWSMLGFRPDRLGHCCRLDAGLEAALVASGIPVELCLTSNLKTSTVPTYADHHFVQLRGAGCPVVLCTDDSGVFGTTLSQEYAIAAQAFGLEDEQLVAMAAAAIDFTFCSPSEQQWLRDKAAAAFAAASATASAQQVQ